MYAAEAVHAFDEFTSPPPVVGDCEFDLGLDLLVSLVVAGPVCYSPILAQAQLQTGFSIIDKICYQ